MVVVVAIGIVLIEGAVVVSVIVLLNKEMTLELVTGPNFPDLAILKVSVQLFPVLIVNFDDVNLHGPFTDQVFLPGEFVEATADNAIVCLLLRFVIFHVTRVDEAALTR